MLLDEFSIQREKSKRLPGNFGQKMNPEPVKPIPSDEYIAIQKRMNSLRQQGMYWYSRWKDICSYICPTRGMFDEKMPNQGDSSYSNIIDNSGSIALRTLAAFMMTGLTNPARPWFRLSFEDPALAEYEPVKVWLANVQKILMDIFAKSNTYSSLNQMYEELAGPGTAAALIVPDFKDVIRLHTYTIGEYYLGADSAGRVDSIFHYFWMTVKQLVDEFGYENVTPSTQTNYDQHQWDSNVRVWHLIEPNTDVKVEKVDALNMPWRSVYWEASAAGWAFLRKSGYRTFPAVAPRWNCNVTSSVYGQSPAWDALSDVKMLQKLQSQKLIALDKKVDPPMLKDAGITTEVNTLPGGITPYNSQGGTIAGLKPAYEIDIDFADLEGTIMKTKENIDIAFYKQLIQMMVSSSGPAMTATEVRERVEEKMVSLGAVTIRLENELLKPLIDRTFDIAWNTFLPDGRRLIPEPPEEISEMDIKVEYISMLAQTAKLLGTRAIEQTFMFAGQLAQLFPQALDVLDAEQAVEHYADMQGVDPHIVHSDEEISRIRQERQQAQQMQAQQMQAQQMVDGAKTLSETKVGQGGTALDNALKAITGQKPQGE
jgi:hypothetical protein